MTRKVPWQIWVSIALMLGFSVFYGVLGVIGTADQFVFTFFGILLALGFYFRSLTAFWITVIFGGIQILFYIPGMFVLPSYFLVSLPICIILYLLISCYGEWFCGRKEGAESHSES